jgi:DNA repair photolyase
MKRWGDLNPIHFDDGELRTDLGSGNFVFVGSSTDDFADGVPSEWIVKILDHCDKHQNRYLFQSKNPARIMEFIEHPVFRKAVVCTTIESNRFYPEVMMNSPRIESRVQAMEGLATLGISTYVTCEPLLEFDLKELVSMLEACHPQQVNIGRNSRREIMLPEPSNDEVKALITELGNFTKVEVKKNAKAWIKE